MPKQLIDYINEGGIKGRTFSNFGLSSESVLSMSSGGIIETGVLLVIKEYSVIGLRNERCLEITSPSHLNSFYVELARHLYDKEITKQKTSSRKPSVSTNSQETPDTPGGRPGGAATLHFG